MGELTSVAPRPVRARTRRAGAPAALVAAGLLLAATAGAQQGVPAPGGGSAPGARTASGPQPDPDCSAPLVFVPAAAHLEGDGGSEWRTDVSIYNRTSQATSLSLWFFQRGGDSSSATCVDGGVLAAGTAVRLEDVVLRTFGVSAAGAVGVGAGGVCAEYLVVSSRTYNQSSSGTFGQGIPGLSRDGAVAAGMRAVLTQLYENESYRTNIGLFSLGDVAVVEVELYASDGSPRGQVTRVLQPYDVVQLNRVYGAGAGITGGFAEVRVTWGGRVAVFASVVDNQTGDPTYVSP